MPPSPHRQPLPSSASGFGGGASGGSLPVGPRSGSRKEAMRPLLEDRLLPDADELSAGSTAYSFRLRQVKVDGLLQDGTLGLLLHGTSVVGFCSEEAADNGWTVGDQIVEINGQRVVAFDDFLERFLAAQVEGFPIAFSVLRKEASAQAETAEEADEDPLENFFSETNFVDLAGQLQSKFSTGHGKAPSAADEGEDAITENPYIQALRKRRTELSRSTEGWSDDHDSQSLAARLATERDDALATLSRASTDTPRRLPKPGPVQPRNLFSDLGLPAFCAGRPCGDGDASAYEIRPTPRAEHLDLEQIRSWPGFESPSKVGTPAAVALSARGDAAAPRQKKAERLVPSPDG